MKENICGEFLRKKRQQCGLTQYQLGMLLKVSDKAVSKWENGLAKPKSQLLHPLSEKGKAVLWRNGISLSGIGLTII